MSRKSNNESRVPTVGPPTHCYHHVENDGAAFGLLEAVPTAGSYHGAHHPWVYPSGPHRKFYIVKQPRGCCGVVNACCCGVFDEPGGCCAACNMHGCCNRERKVLQRVGHAECEDVRPRWRGNTCCCD